jgi:hypothetical protein
MPSPRPPRQIRRAKACRSNLRRQCSKAWLEARLVEKIQGLAAMMARKQAAENGDEWVQAPPWDPRSGPASREGSCEAAANTPSMPR